MPDYQTDDFTFLSEEEWALELKQPQPEFGLFLWNYGRNNVEKIVIEEGITQIGSHNFSFFRNLSEVSISQSVVAIGDEAFYSCEKLSTVFIPASVKSIGKAIFGGNCESLSTIDVDMVNPQFVSIEGVLYEITTNTLLQYPCNKLGKQYTIPEYIEHIGNDAFNYCSNLVTLIVSDSLKSIGARAFSNCKKLSQMAQSEKLIKKDVCYVPQSVISIGEWAFSNCQSFKIIYLLAAVSEIKPYTFYNCKNLHTVTISNNLMEIKEKAFGKSGLKSVFMFGDNIPICDADAFYQMDLSKISLLLLNKDNIKLFKKAELWKNFGRIECP
jgi:hypothetical protein